MGWVGLGTVPESDTECPSYSYPAEGSMTAMTTPVTTPLEHRWELRLEEFEDGHSIRRYECVLCGAVRFE